MYKKAGGAPVGGLFGGTTPEMVVFYSTRGVFGAGASWRLRPESPDESGQWMISVQADGDSDAPPAGQWFAAQARELIELANPPLAAE